jgi:hypothetical protein
MEGIEHDGASTWMRLQTHDETVSVRKQPRVWLLWRCVSHGDILTLSVRDPPRTLRDLVIAAHNKPPPRRRRH